MKGSRTRFKTIVVLLVCFAVTGMAGYARCEDSDKPAPSSAYLLPNELPDSLRLLPAPPAEGSAAFALDEEVSNKNLTFSGTPLWKLAAEDAELTFPHATESFSCAFNAPINGEETPRLYSLLRKSFIDLAHSTRAAKDKYARPRPFAVNKRPTCTPGQESQIAKNGSYPSGHATVGWGWALILAEISPEYADAVMSRGRAFAQNRSVCNVHWQSDVTEGLVMGAATVARLHGSPAFRADLEAARTEIVALRVKGPKPTRDCKAEAAALVLQLR